MDCVMGKNLFYLQTKWPLLRVWSSARQNVSFTFLGQFCRQNILQPSSEVDLLTAFDLQLPRG